MKKILTLTIITLSILTSNTYAQTFKIGIKGGTDIKKLTGKSFDEHFSYGYHIGAFAELGLSSKLGLQPEVYFSQVNIDTSKSFSDVYHVNSFDKISKIQLKYLTIPILLSYKANKFISLQAGPQFGILMDKGNTILENGKDAFKKGDFGLLAGLQLNISKIRLYGRYGVGLNNINDIDDREKWKSQTIQLGLGLTF